MSCDQKTFKNTALERPDTERWVSRDGRKSSLWSAYRPWLISLLHEMKMRAKYTSPGVEDSPTLLPKLWSNYENAKPN